MDVDVIQFWNRLAVSNVLDAAVCAKLQSQFESEFASGENHVENLVNWLRERKAISSFQADILQSPDGGRLQFGNYLIVAEPDASGDFFRGLHKLTRHPVQLVFFSGSDQSALNRWRSAQALARVVSSNPHPNVLRLFECVAIPDYRFIVTEPPLPMLTEKIALKSRLPHQAAADIVGQIAVGLAHLQELGIEQGETEQGETDELTESAIRLGNQRLIQLIPGKLDTSRDVERNADSKTNRDANESSLAGNNCRRLGQIWYRLLTGREPQYEGQPETTKPLKEELLRLKKLETPNDSIRVIQKLLGNVEPEKIPLAALAAHCKKFGSSQSQQQAKRPESIVRYEQWLQREPGVVTERVQLVDDAEFDGVDFGSQESLQDSDLQAARTAVNHQGTTASGRTNRRNSLIPIAGSLLVLACLVGLVAALTARIPSESFRDLADEGQVASNENPTSNSSTENRSETSIGVGEGAAVDSVNADPNVVLIEDDQESLWESPTNGQPISLKFVPPAAKIILHVRLADLNSDESGQLLLQSFGPAINSELDRVEQRLGVPREEIESLLISFHSNDELEYETFTLASLSQPKSTDATQEFLNNPIAKTDKNDNAFFQLENGDHLFLVAAENQATAIALASEPLIQESLANYDTDVSRGAIKNLAQLSDSERHLSIIALRPGLFNDEGQKLMGPALADLNRDLSLSIDERIRGIGMSLHLDQGSFLEFSFDSSADIKNDDLKQFVQGRIAAIDSNVSRYLAGLPQHPFWESVSTRLAGMSNNLTQNLRCDIENRQVTCNGWFAPAAAHNWFAAGEMLLSFANPSQAASNASDKPQKTIPQTIEELLQAPRDLAVSTSPDLILLIENLQQEILDEYGALPFEFEIRLMGADLSKEGITQNQRPSDFAMEQRSLADILTEIMVQANPDKNITGADDPNCKMVWVVADDPADSNRRIILITTRKAANEKSYRLPAAFIPK